MLRSDIIICGNEQGCEPCKIQFEPGMSPLSVLTRKTMKVVIDAFDTEEQAVAFIDWFKKQADNGKIALLTTDGLMDVQWDGVDIGANTQDKMVLNICVDYVETYD